MLLLMLLPPGIGLLHLSRYLKAPGEFLTLSNLRIFTRSMPQPLLLHLINDEVIDHLILHPLLSHNLHVNLLNLLVSFAAIASSKISPTVNTPVLDTNLCTVGIPIN